jgi:hypothetical protein
MNEIHAINVAVFSRRNKLLIEIDYLTSLVVIFALSSGHIYKFIIWDTKALALTLKCEHDCE